MSWYFCPMRKNQKSTKEKMFQAIETWQESGQTKKLFCKNKKYSKSTFYYWLKKYQEEKQQSNTADSIVSKGFFPVKISDTIKSSINNTKLIDIYYPNGVRISCPAGLKTDELRTLINL